jgi:hypothetical protein
MPREHPCGNADDGCPNLATGSLCDECQDALEAARPRKNRLYDRGGYLPSGAARVRNNTGRAEPIGPA